MGNGNSRKRNEFPYANINNKDHIRLHFLGYLALKDSPTTTTTSFSFSVQPSAGLKSRKVHPGTLDRCEGFLASYAVYKHYCTKICFAKGKHHLWNAFSFHEEERSVSGTICRISIIQRYTVQISKVTGSPRHITE